ncbi:hypothetical protein BKA82DRAFT_715549 [Pisolithus tinctorius]|uniref:Uncharacterized protein n=1 Tax=Pisolithus tinctorius Marx 270 TaxID=870435 RepID=A0A0C3JXP0_PISTI|nr:hypothetical protein BKA82DRAFT_715549 [Pisolithus tinctorius]KIO02187.1 hypothetical protein M404DRAFT_715549 [Pisolithus tinctorius Marx 270]
MNKTGRTATPGVPRVNFQILRRFPVVQPLAKAIIAPKPTCFDCYALKRVSFGTGSKFSHVRKVTPDISHANSEGATDRESGR